MTFTRADWARLCMTTDEMEAFRAFVLARFAAYTRETAATTGRGMPVAPVSDPHLPEGNGWERWRVAAYTLFNPTAGAFSVERQRVDEGSRIIDTESVALPLDFVFTEESGDDSDPAPAASADAPGGGEATEGLDVAGLPPAHLAVLRECVAEAWRNHEQNDAVEADGVAFDIVRRLESRFL